MKSSLLFAVFWFALSGSAVLAQDFLQNLNGNWTGRGKVTTDVNSPMKRSRCKMTALSEDAGNSLIIKGRCSVAIGAANLVIKIVDDGNGRVRSSVQFSALAGTIQFLGEMTTTKITLSSRENYELGSNSYKAKVTIQFVNDSQFRLVEWNALEGATEWNMATDLYFRRVK